LVEYFKVYRIVDMFGDEQTLMQQFGVFARDVKRMMEEEKGK
jgi:hypothetical protein